MFSFLGSSPVSRRLQFFEVIISPNPQKSKSAWIPSMGVHHGDRAENASECSISHLQYQNFPEDDPDPHCGRGDPLTHPPSARRGPTPPLLWPTRSHQSSGPISSVVLLKLEVGIRKRAWQRDWRYPAYLWSLRWVYAVKRTREVGIPAYTPQYTTAYILRASSVSETFRRPCTLVRGGWKINHDLIAYSSHNSAKIIEIGCWTPYQSYSMRQCRFFLRQYFMFSTNAL